MTTTQQKISGLLGKSGTTFATDAGITLRDKPSPLYRLLVLAQLLSTRISADIAVAAARELASYGTARRMADASWQDLVDALGRAHYKRYDESTATRLGENAKFLLDRYDGDLRELARASDRDPDQAARLLEEFNGIGPTGAQIFLREVQDVWTWVRPHFDDKALLGARRLGLPTDPAQLGKLSGGHPAELAAALVRAKLN
jgi:hypothetical protein